MPADPQLSALVATLLAAALMLKAGVAKRRLEWRPRRDARRWWRGRPWGRTGRP